jgi:hypothetical protein
VFNGNQYFNNVLSSWQPNSEGIPTDFSNLVGRAYKGNGIVFACEMTRVALVSQAPPVWQRKRAGRWGDLFGTRDLDVLDTPWPGGTFKQLAARMVLNADMGGTAFVARRRERPDRLMLLRPDWVTIVLGSQDDPDGANFAMDADYLGVIYHPGGQGPGPGTHPAVGRRVRGVGADPGPDRRLPGYVVAAAGRPGGRRRRRRVHAQAGVLRERCHPRGDPVGGPEHQEGSLPDVLQHVYAAP